jgi:hypothetical protein
MPQLEDALGRSAEGAAYMHTPEGYRVLVARKQRTRHAREGTH